MLGFPANQALDREYKGSPQKIRGIKVSYKMKSHSHARVNDGDPH